MDAYVNCMKTHWTENLELPLTDPLLRGWRQLLDGLNTATETGKWQVVQLPTGAGKTQALMALCASRPLGHDNPGILIVTRFIKEADQLADGINRLAGRAVALASHQGTNYTREQLSRSEVLIVTQAAYTAALRGKTNDPASTLTDQYTAFHHGQRRWFISDEEFDWIDAYDVDLAEIRAMCAHLHELAPNDDMEELLEILTIFAREVASRVAVETTDTMLASEHIALLRAAFPQNVAQYLANMDAADIDIWASLDKPPRAMKRLYTDLLHKLSVISKIGCAWVSKRGNRVHVHSAQSLLPAAKIPGVILDATAGISPTYEHFAGQVELMSRPSDIRRYDNVTLNVSRGHKLGKQHVTKHGVKQWKKLASQLRAELPADANLLVCTHLDAAEGIAEHAVPGVRTRVAHWGALDGKNEWQDCDTVIINSLPYLNDIVPTNTYLAMHGPQSDAWFNDKTSETGCGYIRQKFKDGFISKCVVQAINRTRCRRTSDHHGNCEPASVYLMLPGTQTGDRLLKAIEDQMPGVLVRDWTAGVAQRKRPTAKTEDELVGLLEASPSGTYSKSEVIRALGISTRTFERLSSKMQSATHGLLQRLTSIGVEYRCSIGAGPEACFVKS